MSLKKKLLIAISLAWYHLTSWLPTAAAADIIDGQEKTIEQRVVSFTIDNLSAANNLIFSAVEFSRPSGYALSESMGQMLLYAALTENKMLWEMYRTPLEKYFWQNGYYAWRVDLSTMTADSTSALIDDLRIAKAYMRQEKNTPGEYSAKIATISAGLLQNSVDADNNISDFFAAGAGAADHVSLFYLDTEVMDALTSYDARWEKVKQRSVQILTKMPENSKGFFPPAYYFAPDDYPWGNDVSMVENLYTAMFAQQVGRSTKQFADFLRGELAKGKIFNRYYPEGRPSFPADSVAVYALAARYFCQIGDETNARMAYDKMMSFYLRRGKFAGGFGYFTLGTVYAFDQFESLLTLSEMGRR